MSAEITAAPSRTLRCPAKFNPKYIKRAWEIVARDGAPREVRILKTERDGTVSGIFTDPEQVAAAIASWDGVKSIYLTVNPLKPEMLARENVGKLTRWTKDTTADADIASRAWLIIDVDPVPPVKHVSATEAEQALAIEVRDRLAEWLTEEYGFPAPIRGRSGNGGRLLYAIELPNDAASTDLIRQCLRALDLHWTTKGSVEIDTSVFNASRVDKVWGTMAVKGGSTDERPHRRAYLDVVPAEILLVPRELLELLAALVPAKPTRQVRASVNAGRDFPELLAARRGSTSSRWAAITSSPAPGSPSTPSSPVTARRSCSSRQPPTGTRAASGASTATALSAASRTCTRSSSSPHRRPAARRSMRHGRRRSRSPTTCRRPPS